MTRNFDLFATVHYLETLSRGDQCENNLVCLLFPGKEIGWTERHELLGEMMGAQPVAPAGEGKVILSPIDYFRTSPDLLTGCNEFYENFGRNQHSCKCNDLATFPLKSRNSMTCRLRVDYQQEFHNFCPDQRLLEAPCYSISNFRVM